MIRHIHVSLRNAEGKNAFAPTKEDLENGGRKNAFHKDLAFVSQEAEWFLAGLIDGLPDSASTGHVGSSTQLTAVMPMFCPNINSYKRLMGGAVSASRAVPHERTAEFRRSGRQILRRTAGTPERQASGSSRLRAVHPVRHASRSAYPVPM